MNHLSSPKVVFFTLIAYVTQCILHSYWPSKFWHYIFIRWERNKVNICGIDKIWMWWFDGVVKSTCVRCPIRSAVSQERVEPLLKEAWYKVRWLLQTASLERVTIPFSNARAKPQAGERLCYSAARTNSSHDTSCSTSASPVREVVTIEQDWPSSTWLSSSCYGPFCMCFISRIHLLLTNGWINVTGQSGTSISQQINVK